MVDKEKQIAGKVKKGVKKAGRTAEHDYDRYSCFQQASGVLLHKAAMCVQVICWNALVMFASPGMRSTDTCSSWLKNVVQRPALHCWRMPLSK